MALWTTRAGTAALLFGALTGAAPSHSMGKSKGRFWRLEDVLTAPKVTDLVLSRDGRSALYVVEVADQKLNQVMATLRRVDIASGHQTQLLRNAVIQDVQRIPGTNDWSALVDLGKGEQLYRIGNRGAVTPLLINPDTVLVGNADEAVHTVEAAAPRQVGVLSYDWSPDGKWLWYCVLKKTGAAQKVRFDDAVEAIRSERRGQIDAEVQYHLKAVDGADFVVATRPASDRIALYFGGKVTWAAGEIRYGLEKTATEGLPSFRQMAFDLTTRTSRLLTKPLDPYGTSMRGPHGGRLAVTGFGRTRLLEEEQDGGASYNYGPVHFVLDDPRSAGNWRSEDGRLAIVGTRTLDHPRYGLEVIGAETHRAIATQGSLTKCDFIDDLSTGVCVREGIAIPPELVLVRTRSGSVQHLASVSSRHDEIAPLHVTARSWVNRLGYRATGFIVWPRHHTQGERHPLIVVTHGSDADERFANPDFQWNYPVQLFAEHGYVVLMINDPAPGQDERLEAAYTQWVTGRGSLSPTEMRTLIWLNSVYSIEKAVGELVAESIVDPERVGIAGYSRGSQITNVAVTQSGLFRAASSGDGDYLEPSGFPITPAIYSAIFGGPPYGPAVRNYESLSPSLRADHVKGAVLEQMALPRGGSLDFYRSLKNAGIPTQITLYPGESARSDETHIFHIPSNRLLAMQENMAWFNFWLLGSKDPMMPFPGRYDAWARMAVARLSSGGRRPIGSSPFFVHQRAQHSAFANDKRRSAVLIPRQLGSSG